MLALSTMTEELTFKPFSESEYYSGFKRIRNKFRKFNSLSVIVSCFNYLHKPTKEGLDELQKLPWMVLLLVKWILLDDEFSIQNKRAITDKKLYELLQSGHDLGGITRLPSDFEHHILFFRSMAYQQFIYQYDYSISRFSRQMLLFSDLPENSLIHSKFKELVGLDIRRFLEISLVTVARFIVQRNNILPLNWYNNVLEEYSRDEVIAFIKAISMPIMAIREKLRSKDTRRRSAQEYFEQTPLTEIPLIQMDQGFLCVYPNILYRCLEHFVYDKLRLWNSQSFMDKFGPIFESYVEQGIMYTKLPYIKESDIKKCLSSSQKVVDFVVFDNDANVFIDAKAVEMAYQGKVTYLSEVVKNKSKVSVIKAIEQSHDVIKHLECSEINHPYLKPRKRNYLLVITFKELYLGNGRTFYEAIGKDEIDSIYKKYEGYSNIKLEDMYFITIDEFDIFIELIKSGKIGLVEGIEKAKENDKDVNTMKFDFNLHLMEWGKQSDIPLYLIEKSEYMFNKLKNILKNK
jgi:hypothetical protein